MTASQPAQVTPAALAAALNQTCQCIRLDRSSLRTGLARTLPAAEVSVLAASEHGTFSDTPVFVAESDVQSIRATIAAVERLTQLPDYRQQQLAAYRQQPLAAGAAGAVMDTDPLGVFSSFDFHPGPNGPQLIEINTNAGGALLSAQAAAAQLACCDAVATQFDLGESPALLEDRFVAMFRAEFERQHPGRTLRTLAIIDQQPHTQFLYPEMRLFQALFERHGIQAWIADPAELQLRAGRLWLHGVALDLVYNRLTDFYLQQPAHALLAQAWQQRTVVLTPNPQRYALLADKRILVALSDPERLRVLGLGDDDINVLRATVPPTVEVTAANAAQLWSERRQWFFKPVNGFGSRGTYSGAGVTRSTWQHIVAGGYIAQRRVPPGTRSITADGTTTILKSDLRAVVYAGELQQLSARLYQGQVTNLRTAGGGLSTVLQARAGLSTSDCCSVAA